MSNSGNPAEKFQNTAGAKKNPRSDTLKRLVSKELAPPSNAKPTHDFKKHEKSRKQDPTKGAH